MNENAKIIAFEYFVIQMHSWYKRKYNDLENNDLSILKLLKLLFFTTAVGIEKDSKDYLIDNVFNNFCAMPYGHVESDVYNYIKKGKLQNVTINKTKSRVSDNQLIIDGVDVDIKKLIDVRVKLLSDVNTDLIKYSAFDLVELSHRWYSWQKNYKIAEESEAYSHPIHIDEIKKEIKTYQL